MIDKSVSMLLIGVVFGALIGFTVAAANGVTLGGHDHGDVTHHQHGTSETTAEHTHGAVLELPQDSTAPSVSIEVQRDPVSGWNLGLHTANFEFDPQHAGLDHVAGHGHAHVFANGVKIARLYAPWMHLDNLPKGQVTVKVALYTNDHRAISVDGFPVEASIVIEN